MTVPEGVKTITITRKQAQFSDWMADVLVYTVVLNLFEEHLHAIVIDSFTISILTAIFLKALLDAIAGLEHRVVSYFKSKQGLFFTVAGLISVFLVLFLGKLFILEAVNFVFGEHVELGHFIEIFVLIVGMMGARKLLQVVYQRLGEEPE
jgi:hypothetical protein